MEKKFCGNCGSPLNEYGNCPNPGCVNYVAPPVQAQPAAQPAPAAPVPPAPAPRPQPPKKSPSAKGETRKKVKGTLTAVKWIAGVLSVLVLAVCVCFLLTYHGVAKIPVFSSLLADWDMIDPEDAQPSPSKAPAEDEEEPEPEEETEEAEPLSGFKANYYDIQIEDSETVTFTVNVGDESQVDTSKLGLYDGGDTWIAKMNDDGTNGDYKADDGIYSVRVELYSDTSKVTKYHASDRKISSNEFSIHYYKSITYEELEAFQALTNTVAPLGYVEALSVISTSAEVVSYDADEENQTIVFETVYGVTGVHVQFASDVKGNGEHALPKDNNIEESDYNRAQNIAASLGLTPLGTLDTDVIVLRPFRNSEFYYDDFMFAGELMTDVFDGYSPNVRNDSSANISYFKSLDDYGVVLIDSHGMWVNDEPYIVTGEFYNRYSGSYSADFRAGRIVVTTKGNLAVNGDFFDTYYEEDSLEGSFWYLGTCHSLHSEALSDVLIEKGAGAVVGYTDSVWVPYCNKTLFETLINSMVLSQDTVSNGVECAKDFYGDTDPDNSDCALAFDGNADYKFFRNTEPVSSDERDIVLVLDQSGSMSGDPINETRTAAQKFVDDVDLGVEACVGIVGYSDDAEMISPVTNDEDTLRAGINEIYASGNTNIDAGLQMAQEMLKDSKAKKKIIVLMSDGIPNEDRVGDELIAYAEELREEGILIYTLGFFSALDSSYRTEAEALMAGIADRGCHYEIADASDLVYFFGDMADQLSGQQYYYVQIACPVDVTVTYNGQTLSSDPDKLSTRTDFGTLTFEEAQPEEETETESDTGDGSPSVGGYYGSRVEDESEETEEESGEVVDNRVKILRLKEGVNYEIDIKGTGEGKMNYTIGFADEYGEYTDMREFEDIDITEDTEIRTVAARSEKTVLKVDEDGDGEFDLIYTAEEDSRADLVDHSGKLAVINGFAIGSGCVLVLVIAVSILQGVVRKKKKTAAAN